MKSNIFFRPLDFLHQRGLWSLIVVIHHVRGCFEDHLDHLMTEVPSMPPLVKIGTHCSIPDRRTTTLKNAKFISQCQFATINYRTLGEESILLPTGDVFTKGSIPIRIYWYGGETVYIFNVWCRILKRRFCGTEFSGRGVCTELGTDGLHSTILKTWDTMSVSLTLNHNLKKIVESIHS